MPDSSFLPRTLGSLIPSKTVIGLLLGCFAWYTTSALSSTTSKAILSASKKQYLLPGSTPPVAPFPLPVTLTWIQFLFVHAFCQLACCKRLLGRHTISTVAPPSWSRIVEVGQLSVFTVVGHALSSLAISRVPVATVQTIKALSPLFTVVAYAGLFGAQYHSRTWLSLCPLTLGVMMACTGKALLTQPGSKGGLLAALASTVIFVAQNIYSKKLLNGNGHGPSPTSKTTDLSTTDEKGPLPVPSSSPKKGAKLDKINILLVSSGVASVLMVPMVLYYDGHRLLSGTRADGQSIYTFHSAYLIWSNGVVHFAQNLFAFTVLSLVSPVTYSVASLLKRVFVIIVAIIWFHQAVTPIQLMGIALTFGGLYMYNNAKTGKDVDEKPARPRSSYASNVDQGLSLPISSSPDPYTPPSAWATPSTSTSTATNQSWLSPAGWSHNPRGRSMHQNARDMLRLSLSSVPEWIRPHDSSTPPSYPDSHASPWSYAANYAQTHAAAYRPGGYPPRGNGGTVLAM